MTKLHLVALTTIGLLLFSSSSFGQANQSRLQHPSLELYPATLASRPDISSPFTTGDGAEVLLAFTKGKRFAVVPVTVTDRLLQLTWNVLSGNQRKVDADDFPRNRSSTTRSGAPATLRYGESWIPTKRPS